MVKVMYTYKLVFKVVIWVDFGIGLWKEKEALRTNVWTHGGCKVPFVYS